MNIYKRFRFPPEIIQHAVWLYHRFNLSHRNIEDLLAERGVSVSYPKLQVLDNRVFVKDGNVLTSAGMTAGVDLVVHFIPKEI